MGISAWKHKRDPASRVGNCPQISYPRESWKTSLLRVHSPHLTRGENTLKKTFWNMALVDCELVSVQCKSPGTHCVLGRQLCTEWKMAVDNQVTCILLWETTWFHPQSTSDLHNSFKQHWFSFSEAQLLWGGWVWSTSSFKFSPPRSPEQRIFAGS